MTKRAVYLQDASVGASRSPALMPNAEQDSKITAILKELEIPFN